MQINSLSNSQTSFKGYLPVYYYANTPDGPRKLTKMEDIKKCQRQVVTHLNKRPEDIEKIKNVNFKTLRNMFIENSKEYKTIPYVSSVYANSAYLLTGEDALYNKSQGREIGVAISSTREREGKSTGRAIDDAKVIYRLEQLYGLAGKYEPFIDKNGKEVVLKLYFEPKYKKDGKLDTFILQ